VLRDFFQIAEDAIAHCEAAEELARNLAEITNRHEARAANKLLQRMLVADPNLWKWTKKEFCRLANAIAGWEAKNGFGF
jgi:hypothetical protein